MSGFAKLIVDLRLKELNACRSEDLQQASATDSVLPKPQSLVLPPLDASGFGKTAASSRQRNGAADSRTKEALAYENGRAFRRGESEK